jgi:D-beta-D-heptose 7-phosphate kinase/D-beta-D-heptose 1-phosphate adenosyltransferase
MAVALAAGQSVPEACKVANVAAGIKVGKLGAATVSLSEINNALSGILPGIAPAEKIKSMDEMRMIAAEMRMSGRRIVFTNGCFDILHRGHAEYLQKSAEMGDVLVVGLNSDLSIERLKGKNRPIHNQDDRAFLLATLFFVDYVVVFDDDTPKDLIVAVSPSVLVKGGDYTPDQIAGAEFVRSRGGVVRVVPFVEGYSTSNILRQLPGGGLPLSPSFAS